MTSVQRTRALSLCLLGGAAFVALAGPTRARADAVRPEVIELALQTAPADEPGAAPEQQSPAVAPPADAGDAHPPLHPATPDPARSPADAAPGVSAAAAPMVVAAADDPFERQNRRFYNGSRRADRKLIGPVARGYRRTVPKPVRAGLHNLISNLGEPVVFVNDVLQHRIKDAVRTLGRFCVNSTIGVVGLVDVASPSGLRHHDNDFGVTLGRYGVKPGAYLFLPLLGPSTVRDAVGTGVDYFISPWRLIHYGGERTVGYAKAVVGTIDTRANAEEDLQSIDNMSTDPYATTRSLYLQNRQALIRGKPVDVQDLPDFDDPAAGGVAPAPAGSVSPTAGNAVEAQPSPAGVLQGAAGALPAPGPAAGGETPQEPPK